MPGTSGPPLPKIALAVVPSSDYANESGNLGGIHIYRILLLAAAFTATGCLPQQLALKPNYSVRGSAVYGSVPIVRVGMTETEVDHLLGTGKSGMCSGGGFSLMMWTYLVGLRMDSHYGTVSSCECGPFTVTGSPDAPSPLADAFVETKLAPQMLPAEVAVVLGRPS